MPYANPAKKLAWYRSNRDYYRRRDELLRRLGLCVDCSRRAKPGQWRCGRCSAENAKACKRYRVRQAQKLSPCPPR